MHGLTFRTVFGIKTQVETPETCLSRSKRPAEANQQESGTQASYELLSGAHNHVAHIDVRGCRQAPQHRFCHVLWL